MVKKTKLLTSFFKSKPPPPPQPEVVLKGRFYNDGYHSIIAEGNESTLYEMVESPELIIGVYQPFLKDPNKPLNELQRLIDEGHLHKFHNVDVRSARRGPIACGPHGSHYKANRDILKKHCPALTAFVDYIAAAYAKEGKKLTGLWWTYYRAETGVREVVWVPCGVMKPHQDNFGSKNKGLVEDTDLRVGVTDRVIGTLGKNCNGKQKKMSFHYQKDKKSKVWVNIYHGMFVCLSEKSSGYQPFNNDFVEHGVEDAEGTWTVTLEFSNK
jgi:hypothetical protein